MEQFALAIEPSAPSARESLAQLQSLRAAARVQADGLETEARLSFARRFCRATAVHWWQVIAAAPQRPLLAPLDRKALGREAEGLAERAARALAPLAPERAVHEIGLIYNTLLPPAWRSQHGVFYTPPELVARLIAQAGRAGVDWTTCRVLDPACGGGAFLAPVARAMLAAAGPCAPRILVQSIANRLRGFEIDPFAAWLSQIAVDAVMAPHCAEAGRPLPLLVTVRDALAGAPPEPLFDLVIGNPPYGRVTLTAEQRALYQRGLFGHANLYGLFTDLALRHTRPGGVVALVTPTSFLAGEYFKNLRGVLGREAPPVSFDLVDARKGVFADVLQETLLAVYRKDGRRRPLGVHLLEAGGQAAPHGRPLTVRSAGRCALPAEVQEPWLVPRSPSQAALIERMSAMPHRLADWGYGVSTGPLVWNRHKPQLATRPGKGRLPLIWAEAISAEGAFQFRAAKRNHAPWFRLMEGEEWLVVHEQCVLLQRTTAKEQRRRLIAAELPRAFLDEHGGAVIENHLNMIRPRIAQPPVSARLLAAFLNSAAADLAFRCVSGSVAVSAYELEALPLPAPAALGKLERLLAEGADREAIEVACRNLYQPPPE